MYKRALGYNPDFLKENVKLPKSISLVELGLFEYKKLKASQKKISNLSLHISKSPIVEDSKKQDEFIENLKKNIDPKDFISIGFHLTGERFTGIGQFGFSSHYNPSEKFERQAIRFLKKVQDELGLPTWIENANFYSDNFKAMKKSYKSLSYIADESKSSLIIDLSHLVIDSHNNQVRPDFLIGLIDWERVVEVHLSGIIEDNNGVYHDGHSRQVHADVWKLLASVRDLLNENIYINLEHTDPALSLNIEIADDFKKVEKIMTSDKKSKMELKPHEYAISYLCKLIPKWIPGVEKALADEGICYKETVEDWAANCEKKNTNLSISGCDILKSERETVFEASHSYLSYIQGRSV